MRRMLLALAIAGGAVGGMTSSRPAKPICRTSSGSTWSAPTRTAATYRQVSPGRLRLAGPPPARRGLGHRLT